MNNTIPDKVTLHRRSKVLELVYNNRVHALNAEFLRVHSPSAEVQQHGRPVLQAGKKDVAIIGIEPVGHYALKISFSDGHDTGLYSWSYLYQLASQQEELWQKYLQQLQQAGASRETKGL